jgi:hypothetical protein
METLLRERAEVFALAIEYGLTDAREALVWACQLISEQDKPSEPILELAGAIRPHPLDVVAMLRRFPGTADPVRVFRGVLATALDLVRARPQAAWSQITLALEQMALHGKVPDELSGPCYGFDDQRLLAAQGTWGNVSDAHAELVAFLELEALPTSPSPPGVDKPPAHARQLNSPRTGSDGRSIATQEDSDEFVRGNSNATLFPRLRIVHWSISKHLAYSLLLVHVVSIVAFLAVVLIRWLGSW